MPVPNVPTFDDFTFELVKLTSPTVEIYSLAESITSINFSVVGGATAHKIRDGAVEVMRLSHVAEELDFDVPLLIHIRPYNDPTHDLWGRLYKISLSYGEGKDTIPLAIGPVESLFKREVYQTVGGSATAIPSGCTVDDFMKKLVRYTALPGTVQPDVNADSREWSWGTLAVAADTASHPTALAESYQGGMVMDLIEALAKAHELSYELRPSIAAGVITFTFDTAYPSYGTDRTAGAGRLLIDDIGSMMPSGNRFIDYDRYVNSIHGRGGHVVVSDLAEIGTRGRYEGESTANSAEELELDLAELGIKTGWEVKYNWVGNSDHCRWMAEWEVGDLVWIANTQLEYAPQSKRIAAVKASFLQTNRVLQLEVEFEEPEPTLTGKSAPRRHSPPPVIYPFFDTPTYVGQNNALGATTPATMVTSKHIHRGVVQVGAVDVVPTLGVLADLIAGTNISITPGVAPTVTIAGTGPAGASFAVPSIGFAAAAVEGISPNVIRADATLKLIFAGDAGTAVPTGGGANTLTINTTAGHGSFAAAGNAVTFTNIWARDSGGGLTWVKPTTVGDEIRQYNASGITFRILSDGNVYGNAQAVGAPFLTFDVRDYDGWIHDINVAGDINSWFNYVGATASKIVWTHGPDGSGGYDAIFGRDLRIIDGEDPGAANIRARIEQTTGLTLNSGLGISVFSDIGITPKFTVAGNTGNTYAAGYVDSVVGYRHNGAAASGNFLRGNGTNFVSSAIQASDIAGVQLWTSAGGNLYPTTAPTEVQLMSGTDFAVYSDAGSTLKASIDGATGAAMFGDLVTVTGTRPVFIRATGTALGTVRIQGASGGWITRFGFIGSANTDLGGFGAQGSADALTKWWIGSAYNTSSIDITTALVDVNVNLNVDGTSIFRGDASLYSGADLLVYSDAGTTLKASIDGATGQGYFAGNVGIGQAPTAAYELTVKGDVYLPAKWKTGTGWAKFIVMEPYATDSAYTTMIEAKYDHANRFNLKYGGTVFLGVYTTNVYLKTNTGVGTTTPRKALDVLATAAAQLRLTHTDDSVYTDFRTLDTGVLTIAPTGGIVQLQSGVDLEIYSDAGVTKKFDVDGATGNATAQGIVYSGSYVNAVAGYRVAGAANAGQYLRGNGTNIVLSAIQAGDLPAHTHAIGFTATATGNQSASHNHVISFTATASGNQSASHNHALTYTATATGINTNFTNRYVEGEDSKAYFWTASDAAGTGAKWQRARLIDGTHTHNYDKANTPTGNQSASHTHQYDKSNTPTGNQSASHTHQYDKSNTPTI